MSIRFRECGEPRREKVTILSVPPERRIRFLGTPDEHVQVYLHWVGSHSVPCLGDECELCYEPPILMGYAAVSHYMKPRLGGWVQVPAIMPITENCLGVLDLDHRGMIFMASRHNGLANGRMVLKMGEQVSEPTVPMFNVKEKLILIWSNRDRVPKRKITETISAPPSQG